MIPSKVKKESIVEFIKDTSIIKFCIENGSSDAELCAAIKITTGANKRNFELRRFMRTKVAQVGQ